MAMTEEQKAKTNKGFAIAGTVLQGAGGILSSIFGGGVGSAVGGVASTAGNALSGLSGEGIPVSVGVEDKSRKTLIYVAVGVGAVILIAAIFGFAGRRKR